MIVRAAAEFPAARRDPRVGSAGQIYSYVRANIGI